MTIRILNVNDSASNRYYVSRVLRSAGWDVIEAASGGEGLAKARTDHPSVVVLDIRLPDMSGLEVCRMLRSDPSTRGLIIVQTSATFVTSEGKVRGMESGADQYLTQPFEPVELIAMVKSLLRLRDKETESREKAEALLDADRRKDEYLAMLSHELRNPLAAISTATSLLEARPLDETSANLCATIARQTSNLARLVEDLLDVSRITRGKIELHKEPLDLGRLVRQVVTVDNPKVGGRRLLVSIGSGPMPIDADPTRIEQIVFNLLGNALKYTAESGTISVSVSPADLRNAPAFALRIEDDGVGLAEADLASIFDLFYQVDQSLARSAGGLGIGLTMVKRLVELHDGALTVASAGLGKGSVFTVTLPASQQTRARPVSSQGAASSVAGAAYSVLIVDDNVDSRELQSMALEKLGHAVKGANDGVEGIALALEDDFDVALVDIGLPIVDGYEVARRIRAEKKEHRPALIAVTGYGRDSDRERALQAGFDAHLVKPVKQAALLATIDHAVRKRRGAQSRSGT